MDYQKLYQEKKITPDQAVGLIEDNDIVAAGFCAAEPFTFLSHFQLLKDRVKNVRVFSGITLGKYDFMYNPEYRGIVESVCPFSGVHNRTANRLGLSTVFPGHLHNLTRRYESAHHMRVLCMAVSPMDRFGFFRLSMSCTFERTVLETVDLVLLEVNPNLPDVGGDNLLHVTDVDYLMEVNTPVPVLPRAQIGPEETAIGAHVASLIRDGDTIQLGIGSIPDAAALAFRDKRDLGVHTEMLTSTVADLAQEGVINNKRKSYYKDRMPCTFIFGDEKLYRFVDRNPAVLLMDSEFVNNPFEIAKNDNMVSINTSLAVDLAGQAASETVGTLQYSGSGGQNDTAEGAIHAKNGRSILALKSTAKQGTISAISACLPMGSVVTLSRNNVDYIITEYGIAKMKGMDVSERARALIGIAHPDFRAQLTADAKKYDFL